LYALSFLGASAAGTVSVLPAVLLGLVLCMCFAWMISRKYARTNPTLFYFFVFLLLSALGVAGLRGENGLAQSLASRYRIYSNLALVAMYLFTVSEIWDHAKSRQWIKPFVLVAMCCSMLFCAASDMAGYRLLSERRMEITQEMRAWELTGNTSEKVAGGVDADPVFLRQQEAGIYSPEPNVLWESGKLGVYRIPTSP
jgi:hypothetical protein